MWKLGSTCSRYFLTTFVRSKFHVRTYLSESFKLEQAWNERLASPILKKINVNDMFYELDHQFQHYANASALDIDLFVNAVNDDLNFDELEDVVHKLRLSPEAVNILPSTSHALIRHYVKFNKTDDLLRVLDDRLNYGIFADDYCTLLLMDTFIKNNNFRDAAKVSTIHMLQEDFKNPLINFMSLYSCHKYLENPVVWNEKEEVQDEEDDDDEAVKVRVRYIRNPYFDDHFDLVDPDHLIGKTFQLIGSHMDDSIGRTHQLLGYILHEKYGKAKLYVQKLLSSKDNNEILKDGLAQAVKILDDKQQNKGNDENIAVQIKELLTILHQFPETNYFKDADGVLQILEKNIKSLAQSNETFEIEKQLKVSFHMKFLTFNAKKIKQFSV